MLTAGLVLFGFGSPVAGLADSTGQLIAARAGMGVGGALLLTTILAVAMQIFTPDEHPKAIGIRSAVNALGFAAGPPPRRLHAEPLAAALLRRAERADSAMAVSA